MNVAGSPSIALPTHVREFIAAPHFGSVATVDADGSPRQATIWYLLDGDELVINSRAGPPLADEPPPRSAGVRRGLRREAIRCVGWACSVPPIPSRSSHRHRPTSPRWPGATTTTTRQPPSARFATSSSSSGSASGSASARCTSISTDVPRVVELAGGVGGAKLADGLQAVVGADLTVVVNTGDDLERHGLQIWPDHDTVAYTLAGLDDEERGWGLADESWTVIDRLAARGEDAWFRLGDRDLATHLVRTERLGAGERPTDVALRARGRRSASRPRILPMTDDAGPHRDPHADGWLEFQEYFVHRHQAPEVREVRFRGIEAARPTPEVTAALAAADVIVIAPSNPIVSIGPILAVPGMREALAAAARRGRPDRRGERHRRRAGRCKGPADRMLASLGLEPTALGVARIYAGLATASCWTRSTASSTPRSQKLGMRTRGHGHGDDRRRGPSPPRRRGARRARGRRRD